MEEDDITSPVGLSEIASGLPEEGSLLDLIKQERAEAAEDKTRDLALPGAKTVTIYVRYEKITDGQELNKIGVRARKQFKREYDRVLYASVDSLIYACLGFYYEIEGQDERKPLTWEGRHITGFTMDLANALGFADKVSPAQTEREIAFGAFDWNDMAILQHNIALGRWTAGVRSEIDEEMFGGNP